MSELLQNIRYRGYQGSARILAETGEGNCFAYSKLRIFNNPFLRFCAQKDSGMGVHFAVAQEDAGRFFLDHLTTNVSYDELSCSDDMHERLSSEENIVLSTKKTGVLDYETVEQYIHANDFSFLQLNGESYSEGLAQISKITNRGYR